MQLREVLSRNSGAIAEVRAFLQTAGCTTDETESLREVAARLQNDRSFRRDLTSYLWDVVDRTNGSVGSSDLLGILALATAGEQLAATADEDVAHRLLRFVMEARRAFEETSAVTPSKALSVDSPSTAASFRNAEFTQTPEPSKITSQSDPAHERPSHRVVPWASALACVLLLALGGAWLHHRGTTVQPASVAVTPPAGKASERAPAERVATTDERSAVAVVTPPVDTPEAPAEEPGRLKRKGFPMTRSLRGYAAEPVAQPATSRPAVPLETEAPANTAMVAASPSVTRPNDVPVAPPSIRTTGPKAPATPISADVLSRRLGARTLSQSSVDNAGVPFNHPRLLRRRPFTPAENPAGSDDIAELHPLDRPRSQTLSTAALARGIVRPTSLGMMAANILYSPVPAYPPAASAAHVQGQVTVQAAIDRDGNVAYARVVSGPPLLRDAAVDAVQHWRYKPFLSGGKPASATAIALVEFELP